MANYYCPECKISEHSTVYRFIGSYSNRYFFIRDRCTSILPLMAVCSYLVRLTKIRKFRKLEIDLGIPKNVELYL